MHPTRRHVLTVAAAVPGLAAARALHAQTQAAVPSGYPADYAAMIEAATPISSHQRPRDAAAAARGSTSPTVACVIGRGPRSAARDRAGLPSA